MLKPGGTLALKEVDLTAAQFGPFPPTLLWHMLEDRYINGDTISGFYTSYFVSWLRRVGFTIHSFQTYVGEDMQPLSEQQRQFCRGFLQFWAQLALEATNIPDTEKEIWQRRIADFDGPENLLNDPDFYLRRPYVLIRATVPT